MKDITVIIRSVQERTEQLCKKFLLDQGVPEPDLYIVREVPFSESMRRSFSIGIEKGKKWTLCVDADVLARPGSVKKMVEYAEAQNVNVAEIQGYILDKFFGGVRRGGFHLYRTSLLPKVLKCIPVEGVNLRPETYALQKMKEKGHPRAVVPYIVGTHDDEQFNFHIYRKAFVQAEKHLESADLLVSHWKKNVTNDPDFEVALKAFSDSIKNTKPLYINSDQSLYKDMFIESGFEEKEELDVNCFTLEEIEKRIHDLDTNEKYYKYYPKSQGLDSELKAWARKLKISLRKRGIYKSALLVLSNIFDKLSKLLSDKVSHSKFEN